MSVLSNRTFPIKEHAALRKAGFDPFISFMRPTSDSRGGAMLL